MVVKTLKSRYAASNIKPTQSKDMLEKSFEVGTFEDYRCIG